METIKRFLNDGCYKVKSYFKIEERGSTILTELRAGTVTFFTMGYILAVNAAILGDSGGTCDGASDDYDQCQQDLKIDLPTAGLKTLIHCKEAGLKGIALKAKQNVFLEKKKCIRFANKNKMFLVAK